MDFLHQIKTSLVFYWKAFRFLDNHNLWRILVIPAIVNLIISVVIVIIAIKTSGFVVDLFFESIHPENQDEEIFAIVYGLMMVITRGIIFFLYLKVYRYLILISLAPVFASISTKIQTIDSGLKRQNCTRRYLLDCTRGMQIALRNFVIEILLSTVIIVVAFIIAWILPLVPLVILTIESWFVGYAFADYRNEYFGLNKRESRKLIRSYAGLVLGNGAFFNLFLLIPIVGVLFAPVFALVSSGLSINHLEKRKEILCNSKQSTPTMVKS
jgi:CysZ protein